MTKSKRLLFRILFLIITYNLVYGQENYSNPQQLIKDLKKFNNILEDVSYSQVGNHVLASGTITTAKEKRLYSKILEMYEIMDLVEDRVAPVLITIQAQIYEVNHVASTDYDGLGGNTLTGKAVSSKSNASQKGESLSEETSVGSNFSFISGNELEVNLNLNLLEKLLFLQGTGQAKLVSSPVITVTDGHEASILSGGEIPYTYSTQYGGFSTEWRQYGNTIKIKPKLLEPDTYGTVHVFIELEAEVSTLDHTFISENNIPSLVSRKAVSQVTVPTNRALIISGIIYEEESESTTKVPVLGDLLPFLFKRISKIKLTKELVIVVKTSPNFGDIDQSEYLIKTFPPPPPEKN